MDESKCKNYEQCPIFNGTLKGMEMTTKNYQNLYCLAGNKGWNNCKRYMVKEKAGHCPPNLLPNSLKSFEQIIFQMQ